MMNESDGAATFTGLVNLAAERLGGEVLRANDEFFAEKENLLKEGRGIFLPDEYTDRGKWMDGWETRRRREPGHDWAIVKLGLPGEIYGVDIDTNHFLGNHPPFASLEACCLEEEDEEKEIWNAGEVEWTEILPISPLRPGSHNLFAIKSIERWTHLRLNIYPDGGVARLKVYGEYDPDLSDIDPGETYDLACLTQGGKALACSDMFFSPMINLIRPDDPQNMGDGWETRRKRQPGHDWIILKLGLPGKAARIQLDTSYFKGNYPHSFSLEGCLEPEADIISLKDPQITNWEEILPPTELGPDQIHTFEKFQKAGPFTHIRLHIYPDGGVARLRFYGHPTLDIWK